MGSKTANRQLQRNQTLCLQGTQAMLFDWRRWIFEKNSDLWRDLDPSLWAWTQASKHGVEASHFPSHEKIQDPATDRQNDFFEWQCTINSQYYREMLENKLKPAILKKWCGLQKKGLLFLQDNAAHILLNQHLKILKN